jgi:flavin-dependent dehydrogenase
VSPRQAAEVVVVGASVSGLVAAIALANRHVRVEVIDADPAVAGTGVGDGGDLLGDPLGEAGRRRPRRATPQAGHSHAFLARCRSLLAVEAPDVLHDLRAAGCRELALTDHRPATVPRHAAAAADTELVVLGARRTTFEAVLRRRAQRRPEIRLVAGRRATGLAVDRTGPVPQVRGVALDSGGPIAARLVVDATGRRTPMAGWLAEQGVVVADAGVDCGITYLTRFYRRIPGAPDLPLHRGFAAGGSFDRYSCLVFPGDAGTFSVTFGVLPEDRDLRGLRDGVAFNAAVRAISDLAPWVDADHAEAISEVRTMAGLLNRIRRVTHEGRPAVLGWTAVGDAAATTNPAHSRGCTLGAVHAAALADAVVEHRDLADLAEACAAVVEQEQAPWVADSIDQDRQRLARWRPAGNGSSSGDGTAEATAVAGLAEPGLGWLTNGETWLAAQHDAYVWRRFTRLQQLFDKPRDVLADPRVIARVRAVQAGRPVHAPLAGPSHDDLVGLLTAASVA